MTGGRLVSLVRAGISPPGLAIAGEAQWRAPNITTSLAGKHMGIRGNRLPGRPWRTAQRPRTAADVLPLLREVKGYLSPGRLGLHLGICLNFTAFRLGRVGLSHRSVMAAERQLGDDAGHGVRFSTHEVHEGSARG